MNIDRTGFDSNGSIRFLLISSRSNFRESSSQMILNTNVPFQLFSRSGEPIWDNVELIHSGSIVGAISLQNACVVEKAPSATKLNKGSIYILVDTQGNGAKIQIYETPAELAQIEPLYVFVYVKTGYDFSSENASRSP
jgi:hypothetical protein